MQADDYITIAELRAWLNVSRSTVYEWRKKGLPCIGSARAIRISKTAAEKWLAEQQQRERGKTE